jgi:hypothetical protein
MSGKSANSLRELRSLREAVLAEEKAKAQAIIQHLPPNETLKRPPPPPDQPLPVADESPPPEDLADSETPFVAPQQASPPAPSLPRATPPAPVTPPVRPKIGSKDPALIVPLTPKILERLQRNIENSRWSPADLVIELIRSNLHRGYPAVMFGEQVLARGGSYRTLERNPFETALKLVSGQGVFNITVTAENTEFQHWMTHFSNQEGSDCERSAAQVCLFALQTYLESIEDFQIEGWTKHISTEAYSVQLLT